MRLYMINDYADRGPDNIRVALTREGIRAAFESRLDQGWPSDEGNNDYRREVRTELERLLAADEPCSTDLGRGWGGLQLHILDTVD